MSDADTLVLVTGGTGFISHWTIKELLDQGYRVRATVRDPKSSKCEFLKGIPGAADKLELVPADLTSDKGWKEAVIGCTYVLHMASPYVLDVKNPQKDLVEPAVNGTLFVFKACKDCPDVKRVVLTSSVAAVSDCFDDWQTHTYGPEDWNTTSSLSRNPYYYSKTLAEKAAFEFIKNEKPQFDLVVMNPYVVIGPSLDLKSPPNTSLGIPVQMLQGKLPINLPMTQGIVDVRDVALAHVRGMTAPDAAGKRFLLVAGSLHVYEMGRIVKEVAPKELKGRIAVKPPPFFAAKAILVPYIRLTQGKNVATYLSTNWGKNPKFDTSFAREILKIEFRDVTTTLKDSVQWLIENKKY